MTLTPCATPSQTGSQAGGRRGREVVAAGRGGRGGSGGRGDVAGGRRTRTNSLSERVQTQADGSQDVFV